MSSERTATVIAGVIVVLWVASFILDATSRSYDPPASIHALMMAVAGWAFGQRYLERNRKDPDA